MQMRCLKGGRMREQAWARTSMANLARTATI